jgi:hypothetical protein
MNNMPPVVDLPHFVIFIYINMEREKIIKKMCTGKETKREGQKEGKATEEWIEGRKVSCVYKPVQTAVVAVQKGERLFPQPKAIPNSGRNILFATASTRLWGPPSLLSNGYGGPDANGQAAGACNSTAHLHLVPRLRMYGAIPPLPIRLHGVVRN